MVERRRSANPVDVVVTVNQYGLLTVNRRLNGADRRLHIAEEKRIVCLTVRQEKIIVCGFGGRVGARDEETGTGKGNCDRLPGEPRLHPRNQGIGLGPGNRARLLPCITIQVHNHVSFCRGHNLDPMKKVVLSRP